MRKTTSGRNQLEWIKQEFGGVAIGDERLRKRLIKIAGAFAREPQASIPKAFGEGKGAKAAYRFFDNEKTSLNELMSEHRNQTLERLKQERIILAVEDTTSFNLGKREQTQGIGPIGMHRDGSRGYLLHTTLAFNENGVAMGLMDVQCWARSELEFGKRHQRNHKPIEHKESQKWLNGFCATRQFSEKLPAQKVIMIGDREADLYDLFVLADSCLEGPELLIRSCHNRKIVDEEHEQLWQKLAGQPLAGQMEVKLSRQKGRPSRLAKFNIRFTEAKLKPAWHKKGPGEVIVWAILVQEVGAPKGVEPICWRLLTTMPIDHLQEAVQKIQWYQKRWQIEIYHKVLKSVCCIEQHQLQTRDRLECLLAIVLVVAWRILYMTHLTREQPKENPMLVVDEDEWKVLRLHFNASQGSYNLKQTVVWIAQLGGFLARKSDGFPGPKTLGEGLIRLQFMVAGYKLAVETNKYG
jgi:hypothetical protein